MHATLLAALLLPVSAGSASDLTIYNGGFAQVRQELSLDLKKGVNSVSATDITRHLEADSVLLRDPSRKLDFTVLEQSYIGDPLSQERLLLLNEGKTISFEVSPDKSVQGRIVRAPYAVHQQGLRRYGANYYAMQMAHSGAGGQPIIEVDGRLQFSLPGKPLFPSLRDGEVLKPTLSWTLAAERAGSGRVELSYITGGMDWEADYNVVGSEKGERVDVLGWITMDNQSGKDFTDASVALMAGDVSKVDPNAPLDHASLARPSAIGLAVGGKVTERPFDEYHLYTLPRPVNLRDRESKQVEFLRKPEVRSRILYVYDGAKIDQSRYRGWGFENIRSQREYGTQSNPKVWTMREIRNDSASGLAVPLPRGRMRFYQQDGEKLQFVGENVIDHTPVGDTLRVYTGDSFDLKGERRQTKYAINHNEWVDESFEIRLRNSKKEAMQVRVVETLYRGLNWEIVQKSDPFEKRDSNTIEFLVTVPPQGEKVVTYSAHYTW